MVHHLGVGYKFRKPFTDCYRPWAKHKIIQYTPLASLSYFPTGCFDRFDADWNVWKSLVVSSDVQSVIADWNPYMATDHDLVPWLSNGSRIVLFCFFRCFFFWICCSVRFPCNLQHFRAGSCHFNGIATFWSSNLSFAMVFAAFWCSNFSCWMVFCD